VKLEEHYLNF